MWSDQVMSLSSHGMDRRSSLVSSFKRVCSYARSRSQALVRRLIQQTVSWPCSLKNNPRVWIWTKRV